MTTLEEFISESLDQILNAVAVAQSRAKVMGAVVAPTLVARRGDAAELSDENWHIPTTVEFDVAVTATDGKATKGGIGVVAGLVSLGTTGQSEKLSETISRIKFSVPIFFPDRKRDSSGPSGFVGTA
ncbi:hypothetical protein [Lacipirellula sp.]|uniref:hypothetical protein n=1 Tax=Lacipirellula sp. TaxID=2691419 RepID=UPI003D099051